MDHNKNLDRGRMCRRGHSFEVVSHSFQKRLCEAQAQLVGMKLPHIWRVDHSKYLLTRKFLPGIRPAEIQTRIRLYKRMKIYLRWYT